MRPTDVETLTYGEACDRLAYDPITGILTWRKGNRRGLPAGGVSKHDGYLRVNIGGRKYFGQRLAWLLHFGRWPEGEVDHQNTKRADNRIDNLRDANDSENARNRSIGRANTSGFKGACWHKRLGKWQAYISAGGSPIHLGYHSTAEAAHAAYQSAAARMHGEFARTA